MGQSLSSIIKEDSEYKVFLRVIKQVKKEIDLEKIKKEAEMLHKTRVARSLHGKDKLVANKISDANAQDLSWRARLSEMRVGLYIRLSDVEEAISAFTDFVLVTYGDDLKDDGFTTKDQRSSFTKHLLGKHYRFLREGQIVLETLDFLIRDIDQAGFHLRNMVKILEIVTETKGRVA